MSLFDKILALSDKKIRKGSKLDKIKQQRGVGQSAEFRRIVNLPRRVLDLEQIEDLTPIWLRPNVKCSGCDLCRSSVPRLRPIQSVALAEAEQVNGLFAPIGVGHGKELICLLLPDALQAKRAVILTKPRLKTQMLETDIPRYGRHFKLPLDQITVVSYSELSSASSADVLDKFEPDLVIANEMHCLKEKQSARTKRFIRYMKDHPGCRFAGLSGTIANDSVKNYGHLIELALRLRSPLPHGFREMEDWASALDVARDNEEPPMHPGALLLLCGQDALEQEAMVTTGLQSVARQIYRRRLTESVGVVATGEGSCDASLTISRRQVQVPDVVRAALVQLRETWVVGGNELWEAKDVAAKAKQLAAGFYYRWAWPNGEVDHEWLEARNAWHKEVRHILRYQSRPGLDSPLFVANAAERGEIKSVAWEPWKAVRGRWSPQPPTEAVWISDFLVQDVLAWASACEDEAPGIIWYVDKCIGEKLAEAGLSVYAGGSEGDRILQSRERVVAASIHARRDGDNLQHFRRNLITIWPASGIIVEQVLGRSHRAGQLADEVEVETYMHDQSLQSSFATSLANARFQEETQGTRQKILYATRIGLDCVESEEVWNGSEKLFSGRTEIEQENGVRT